MTRYRVISFWICSILIFFNVNQAVYPQESFTPTPETIELESYFPDFGINCPTFETSFMGMTWNNITVGQSTFEEFEHILSKLGDYARVPDKFYGGTSIGYTLPYQPRIGWGDEKIPMGIAVCTQDNLISVLVLNMFKADSRLHNYMSEYGQPDLITWDLRATYRLAFWFERGFAAQIFVGSREHNVGWGRVGLVTYFPYQPFNGYQTRFPYNQTWQQPAYDYYNEGIATEENPFDIPATLFAMTQNPTWTQTPSFTPRQTTTPQVFITPTAVSTP